MNTSCPYLPLLLAIRIHQLPHYAHCLLLSSNTPSPMTTRSPTPSIDRLTPLNSFSFSVTTPAGVFPFPTTASPSSLVSPHSSTYPTALNSSLNARALCAQPHSRAPGTALLLTFATHSLAVLATLGTFALAKVCPYTLFINLSLRSFPGPSSCGYATLSSSPRRGPGSTHPRPGDIPLTPVPPFALEA